MTSINHSNNLCLVTLSFPPSTPPPSSACSPSSDSSSSWTQKITKKIDELKSKLESPKNLKEAKNGYLPEQDSKSLDSLPTQLTSLETVSKLAEFAESLNKDPSNNILNNLCSGLEKFLGFNSDSKGYDGSGIVYSDLDRLCDAVMGFLSGVLEGVKDDENVKHYYPVDKMTETLETIKKSMYTSGGLSEAVDAVRGALGEWDRELTDKIEYVKQKFRTLNESNILSMQNSLNALFYSSTGDVASKLGDCIDKAGQLSVAFSEGESALTLLDRDMRLKLNDSVYIAKNSIREFVAAAQNTALQKVAIMAKWRLDKLRDDLNDKVNTCVHQMGSNIDEKFNEQITVPITKINQDLKKYVQILKQWIEAAKPYVDTSLILVKEILDEVNDHILEHKYPANIRENAKKLHDDAAKLNKAIRDAGNVLSRKISAAQEAVGRLDTALKSDLKSVRDAIEQGIQRYVKSLEKLNGLDRNVQQDLKRLDEGIKNAVTAYAEGYVTAVKNKVEKIKAPSGLKEIKDNVWQAYASKFSNISEFKNTVDAWLRNMILQHNVVIKDKLAVYVNKQDKVSSEDEMRDPIISQIKGTIDTSVFTKKLYPAFDVDQGKIESNMTKVKHACDTFAEQLDAELRTYSKKTSAITTLAEEIAKSIEKTKGIATTTATNYLTETVKLILSDLSTTARKLAKQIDSLVLDDGGCKFKNVEGALDTVDALLKNFETAVPDAVPVKALPDDELSQGIGGKIKKTVDAQFSKPDVTHFADEATYNLEATMSTFKSAYTSLTAAFVRSPMIELNEQLPYGDGVTTDKNELNVKNLKSYGNSHKGRKKELDEAIKKVQKEVYIALNGEHTYTIDTESLNKLHLQITRNLSNLIGEIEVKVGKAPAVENSLQSKLMKLQKLIESTTKEAINVSTNQKVNGLTKISCDIAAILQNNPQNLKIVLDNAAKFYKDVVYVEAAKAIDSIKVYITQELGRVTEDLQNRIKTQYLENINPMFGKMKKSVINEINIINGVIDNRLRTGMKGLLRKIMHKGYKGTDNQLKKLLMEASLDHKTKVAKLAERSLDYFWSLLHYVEGQVKAEIPCTPDSGMITSPQPYKKVQELKDVMHRLLKDIKKYTHYENTFAENLSTLSSATSALDPQALPDAGRPVLRALQNGMLGFVGELGKGYVNKYSMETFKEALTTTKGKEITLTEYGRKCAKVCLSIVPIVTDALSDLKEKLDNEDGKWKKYSIYNKDASHHSLHRLFFAEHGYDPGLPVGSKHGELNHHSDCIGSRILGHLTVQKPKLFDNSKQSLSDSASSSDDITVDYSNEDGVLAQLHHYLVQYFKVGHFVHIDKPRTPCNVYEMLVWLTGLPHHQVYGKLEDHIKTRCVKPKTLQHLEYSKLQNTELRLEQTSMITAHVLVQTIENVCTNAPTLLTTILGTGDELTVYASDFSNNALKFTYPASGEDCLQTFLDILRRLWYVLRYLEGQCGHPSSIYGWRDCQYGKAVDHSNWQCEDHPRKQPKCQANCKPTCQAACQPNTQANCQPASPLMSYFNDCLPGHLPHRLESIGCKSECKTCSPKSKGMPCLTPLGFRAFSGSTKTGKVLCKILDQFLNSDDVSCLFALAQSPPATLAEHFGFTLSLVKGWYAGATSKYQDGFQSVFVKSIDKQSINLYTNSGTLTDALRDAYGHSQSSHDKTKHNTKPTSDKEEEIRRGDLSSLSMVVPCSHQHCGPYLSPLCSDTYHHLLRKNSDTYLSWSVYLPWTFWDLLNSLYNSLCAISCQDWGCKTCMQGDACRRGKHGDSQSACKCPSLVACRGVSPTLYSYGFRFGVPWLLGDKTTKKTCFDIQKQLQNVLQSQYFTELFNKCDEFLFKIRAPFIWLNVALWLLSLLYLIHILVIRLDLLHIKSHLHTPSSHRIAAQSLLAAARVNKLNRVFYLQP